MKNYDFKVEIKRTKRRKTLSLRVINDSLELRIPSDLPETNLEQFIDKNMDWILRRIAKNSQNKSTAKQYTDGEKWDIFGKNFVLKILPIEKNIQNQNYINNNATKNTIVQTDAKKRMALNEQTGEIILSLSEKEFLLQKPEIIRKFFLAWLDSFLKELAQELAQKYAEKLGYEFTSIGIKEYKSMWGLCRGKEIFFNRKLIFAPKWIFEYVVVHEVCHLKHPHHQKAFWQEVGKFYPQYKAAKQWLKLKGEHLMNIKL